MSSGSRRSPSMRAPPQVRFLEVVDVMVGQLLRRLAEDEQQRGGGPYLLAVTGDHSTPVVFGDHSHEPVPFAAAHVLDVVSADLPTLCSVLLAPAPSHQPCLAGWGAPKLVPVAHRGTRTHDHAVSQGRGAFR